MACCGEPPFLLWVAGVVPGLSRAHSAHMPQGSLLQVLRERIPPPGLLTASSCSGHDSGAQIWLWPRGRGLPCSSLGTHQTDDSIPKAPHGPASSPGLETTCGSIKRCFCLKHPMHIRDALGP